MERRAPAGGRASSVARAVGEDPVLEEIVMMLMEMDEAQRKEVLAHVRKERLLSEMELRLRELEAERDDRAPPELSTT